MKEKCSFPIPSQLIVVAVGTMVSYFADLNAIYDLPIVGDVETGFPAPAAPKTSLFSGKNLQRREGSLLTSLIRDELLTLVTKRFKLEHSHSM